MPCLFQREKTARSWLSQMWLAQSEHCCQSCDTLKVKVKKMERGSPELKCSAESCVEVCDSLTVSDVHLVEMCLPVFLPCNMSV